MKVQNPIIGRARGSAGGMTFCKNYDKNVARAKAFEVSNPNTQAQQTQRNFFKQLTALCSDFSEDQLRCLFPSKPKTMSRRNALSKQIAESYAIDGTEKTIDFADIDTLGNASVMNFGDVAVELTGSTLFVNLEVQVFQNTAYMGNYFFVVFVNVTKQEIFVPSVFEEVENNDYNTSAPSEWLTTDTIHAIPFITNAKTAPSGFGTMSVIKRPPHKEA